MEVHAHPGARRTSVQRHAAGGLRVSVTAPAVDGRANEAVVVALAEAFGLRRRAVEVLSGHTARHKRIRITGIGADALDALPGASAADVPR